MSKKAAEALKARLGDAVLEITDFRGDDTVIVAPKDWKRAAETLKSDPELAMDHFIDLTAVDWPEREPELPRFDVLLHVRSTSKNHRIRLKTRVADGEELATVTSVWLGADWAEREVFDMFGIRFAGHPDLRRILLYPEFEGYPLRKDYPIEKAQPLVPYRDAPGTTKLPPFGVDEGQPFSRVHWPGRLAGHDHQVSPAIAVQQGEKRTLSDSDAFPKKRKLPPPAGTRESKE